MHKKENRRKRGDLSLSPIFSFFFMHNFLILSPILNQCITSFFASVCSCSLFWHNEVFIKWFDFSSPQIINFAVRKCEIKSLDIICIGELKICFIIDNSGSVEVESMENFPNLCYSCARWYWWYLDKSWHIAIIKMLIESK